MPKGVFFGKWSQYDQYCHINIKNRALAHTYCRKSSTTGQKRRRADDERSNAPNHQHGASAKVTEPACANQLC
jgi:hypothetical protein